MGLSEARFNDIAKSLQLNVRWEDKNTDGKRDPGELTVGKGEDAATEAKKVEDRAAKLDEQASSFITSGVSKFKQRSQSFILGNPVLAQEIMNVVKAHGDSQKPIETLSPMNGVSTESKTRILSGLNFDGDSHPDFLLVQSFEIFVAPSEEDKRETVAFLAVVSGAAVSDRSGLPTSDMIKAAKLLAISSCAGSGNPIRSVVVQKGTEPNVDLVKYQAFDPSTQSFVSKDVDLAGGSPVSSADIYNSLFKISAYFEDTTGYLSSALLAQRSKGEDAENIKKKAVAALYNRLSFAFGELERRYNTLKVRGGVDVIDGVNLTFARVLIEESRKSLLLSEEDKNREGEIIARSQKVFGAERDKFQWNGKTMSRSMFYNKLATIEDPKEREALAAAYSVSTIAASKQDGGLLSAIDKLNEIAQRYGYQNYADFSLKVNYGTDEVSFRKSIDQVSAKDGEKLDAFLNELKSANNGQPVHGWDVGYLTNKLIMARTGLEALPTIPAAKALEIIKRYYADIGIDLDKPPYAGNIFYDIKARQDKYPNAATEGIVDGSKAWYTGQVDPTKELSLQDFDTMLHELGHAIQFITGSGEVAGGNYLMNSTNSQTVAFAEGYAMSNQYLVYTQGFMDRYFADLPQFKDPKLREVIGNVKGGWTVYDRMKVMVRALQEMEMYHTKGKDGRYRSFEERVSAIAEMPKHYLHVETTPDKLDFWSIPHPHGINLYYSNYSAGRETAEIVGEDYINAINGEGPIENSAAMALEVFKQGVKLRTQADIRAFVEKRRAEKAATPEK